MSEFKLVDYNKYQLTFTEVVLYGSLSICCTFAISYIFYNHLIFSILSSPLGILFFPYIKGKLICNRKRKLKKQFKESLYGLSSSISTGKSIESAFDETIKELEPLETKSNNYILEEFRIVVDRINNNERIEDALVDFAIRADDEDISDFVNVFVVAKRAGGNLMEIMKFTTSNINEKMDVDTKIELLLTEKKFEQKIMCFMLPLIILYLHLFLNGFIDPLYNNGVGRGIMTLVLVLYVGSIVIGNRIVNIKV